MAGVLINVRGTILFIDPLIYCKAEGNKLISEADYVFKTAPPIRLQAIPRADGLLYTHADADHFGKKTARAIYDKSKPEFVVPLPVKQELLNMGIPEDQIILAKDFRTLRIGNAEIQVTPAMHDWQKENPWKRGDCCGFLIRTPDGTIWHPGDTRLIDDLLTVKDVDVLFFDVAAVSTHLGPKGSSELAKSCKAKLLIAYHYGTFDLPPGTFGSCDPKDSLAFVKDLDAQFVTPPPGQVFDLPL
jgi:L-ascorbate metabolism protein UlaG (beta-lactamase superfamily)